MVFCNVRIFISADFSENYKNTSCPQDNFPSKLWYGPIKDHRGPGFLKFCLSSHKTSSESDTAREYPFRVLALTGLLCWAEQLRIALTTTCLCVAMTTPAQLLCWPSQLFCCHSWLYSKPCYTVARYVSMASCCMYVCYASYCWSVNRWPSWQMKLSETRGGGGASREAREARDGVTFLPAPLNSTQVQSLICLFTCFGCVLTILSCLVSCWHVRQWFICSSTCLPCVFMCVASFKWHADVGRSKSLLLSQLRDCFLISLVRCSALTSEKKSTEISGSMSASQMKKRAATSDLSDLPLFSFGWHAFMSSNFWVNRFIAAH